MDSIELPIKVVPARGVHNRPTEEQWRRCHSRLFQLYKIEKKTLREAMFILAQEQGLNATEKMFKTRIKHWNLERRTRRQDVLAVLRKQHERQGKPTIFLRAGQIVDMDTINRYAKRNRISYCRHPWLLDATHDISDEIFCVTPPAEQLSPLAMPDILRIPEDMLYHVRLYMERLFATDAFSDGVLVEIGREANFSRSLYDMISIGCRQHWEGHYSLAWAWWRRAFELVDSMVQGARYRNMINFVRTASLLYHAGHPELARRLYVYISNQCETRVSPNQPQHTIYTCFKALAAESIVDVNDRIELLCVDLLDTHSIANSHFRFAERRKYARQQLLDKPQSQLEDFLPGLAELDKCFGNSSRQSLEWIHLQSTTFLYRKCYQRVQGLVQELSRRLKGAKGPEPDRMYFAIQAFEVLGLSQYYQHDDAKAAKSFKTCLSTISMYTNLFGSSNWASAAANCLQCLKTIASSAGKQVEAAEYHAELLQLVESDTEEVVSIL